MLIQVYSVTLPTAGCFNFTVDPQGILSSVDSTNYGEEIYPGGTAGYIIATEETGAYINNKSSVPIKLMVEAYVESDDSTGAASSVNLLPYNAWREVNAGIDNNVWLTLDITNDYLDVTTFEDATSIKTGDTLNEDVIAITQNGKPEDGKKGTQISFALDQAAYEFTGSTGNYTYTMKADEKGDSVGIRLGGLVNKNADWSAYAGDSAEAIVVKTVFDFDKLSTDYAAASFDGRAHGALGDVEATYFAGLEYDESGVATGATVVGEMDYAVGQGALQIPFDFGTGINELKVKTITVNGGEVAATDYKVINGEICFKSTEENVKAAMEAATAEGVSVPVVITTSDDMETTVNVTMYQ